MIEPTPRWTFTTRYTLRQWYDHVHLLPTRALGQWCCLDRKDGRLLWERWLLRPNTIRGVTEEVIVASETRSDGPWTMDFGCYGISMRTGRLLWTSHARGWWGPVVRLLDYVPGFTNELRDTPHHVVDNEVFCESGRVLDVETGKDLRRVTPEEVGRFQEPRSEAQRLCNGERIRVGDNWWLSHKKEDDGQPGRFRLCLLEGDGTVLWEFDIHTTGMHLPWSVNFYSYRYVSDRFGPPHVYLVVSEEPQVVRNQELIRTPTRWHLLALDVLAGKIVGDTLVDEEKVKECRIG
jgi:hypothetical protein